MACLKLTLEHKFLTSLQTLAQANRNGKILVMSKNNGKCCSAPIDPTDELIEKPHAGLRHGFVQHLLSQIMV